MTFLDCYEILSLSRLAVWVVPEVSHDGSVRSLCTIKPAGQLTTLTVLTLRPAHKTVFSLNKVKPKGKKKKKIEMFLSKLSKTF